MEAGLVSVMFGFFVGGYLFSRVSLWLAMCAQVVWIERRSWQLALAMSLFHSGPWLLLVVAVFAYHVRAHSWATPFFVALVMTVVLMSVPVIRALPQLRKAAREGRNAA